MLKQQRDLEDLTRHEIGPALRAIANEHSPYGANGNTSDSKSEDESSILSAEPRVWRDPALLEFLKRREG